MLIDRLVRWLLPRQDHFFTLLEEIAAKMVVSSNVFLELADTNGHEQFDAIAQDLGATASTRSLTAPSSHPSIGKTSPTSPRPWTTSWTVWSTAPPSRPCTASRR